MFSEVYRIYDVAVTITNPQIEIGCIGLLNPFQDKPWILRVCRTSLLKTLWEKEKLLVTNNFSFFHSVFYPFGELSVIFIKFEIVLCNIFKSERVLSLLFGKGLIGFKPCNSSTELSHFLLQLSFEKSQACIYRS